MSDHEPGKMTVRKAGALGYLVFDNPARRNAVSRDMWAAIPTLLDDFEADPAIGVIIICGAGDKAFVSGADISELNQQVRSSAEAAQATIASDFARRRLRESPKPTIAMIRGFCLGGGLNVALSCDLRIAAESAKFGIPAGRLGVGYGAAGLSLLMQTVGAAAAREILLTARHYTSDEALRMGLIHKTAADISLDEATHAYAASIADNAPLTLAAAKFTILELLKDESDRDLRMASDRVARCFGSDDYKEGLAAFKEKRKPLFVGR